MHLLCIYKKSIILSLFKIDTLNFPMYILTILTGPLKTYVVRLHNLTSMNISFTIDHKRLWGFFVIAKKRVFVFAGPRPFAWLPALVLAPKFVFTGPGPQFIFTVPGPQFAFTGHGPQFVFTSPGSEFVFTGPGLRFVLPIRSLNLHLPYCW